MFVYAKLMDRIMPMDRGDRDEDPLGEALEKEGYGAVVGGGTMADKTGEIMYAGLDIELINPVEGLPFVCEFLNSRGAAKGSALEFGDDVKERAPFGVTEGIGVYFDGVNLPDEVYRDCDINVVYEEFNRLLEGEGEIRGTWQGPTETAFYIYGKSAETMKNLLAGYIAKYPLCRNARVVEITPH